MEVIVIILALSGVLVASLGAWTYLHEARYVRDHPQNVGHREKIYWAVHSGYLLSGFCALSALGGVLGLLIALWRCA